MPIESHIDSLKTRHQELENKLSEMRMRTSITQNELTQLKREKLRLKDKIQRLSH